MEAVWEQFETAVAKFVQALDPTADVRHNVTVPDSDTGSPRQRDVWVNATVCKVFHVTVLISCKHLKRKLNAQHVDAFVGELRSSGAHKGVLYTFSGYTRPAIEKAKKLGISCCRLYADRPPEIPEVIVLSAYCSTPMIHVGVVGEVDPAWGAETWTDLFALSLDTGEGAATLVEVLERTIKELEEQGATSVAKGKRMPHPVVCHVRVTEEGRSPIVVEIAVRWRTYRARLESFLVNGSYEYTHGLFHGSQTTPSIDTRSPEPGPGWELLDPPPDSLASNLVHLVLFGGCSRAALQDSLGTQVLAVKAAPVPGQCVGRRSDRAPNPHDVSTEESRA